LEKFKFEKYLDFKHVQNFKRIRLSISYIKHGKTEEPAKKLGKRKPSETTTLTSRGPEVREPKANLRYELGFLLGLAQLVPRLRELLIYQGCGTPSLPTI
jgi:hypothetical protein